MIKYFCDKCDELIDKEDERDVWKYELYKDVGSFTKRRIGKISIYVQGVNLCNHCLYNELLKMFKEYL